jgi:hypothetical protein
MDMGRVDEFRKDSVRIALTSFFTGIRTGGMDDF